MSAVTKELITLEQRIASLTAITIPMLMVNAAIASLLSSLLLEVLDIEILFFHYLASFTLAIGIGWTVLNTSVHSYLIKWYIPVLFAIGSFFLLLIKFKVFKQEIEHFSWYITRVFLALMGAAVEYTFSHLFVKKYQEKNDREKLIQDYDRLLKTIDGLRKSCDSFKLTIKSQQETIDNLREFQEALFCTKCEIQHYTVSSYKGCGKNHKK